MLKDERQAAVLSLLEEHGYLSVGFLTEKLHYSPATLRRDIRALIRAGYAQKAYGGVALASEEKPLSLRGHDHSAEKAALAAHAADLVKDGDSVFIAASSSTASLLRPLLKKKDLCVVTTDLSLALDFERAGVRVFCIGGLVSGGVTSGPLAAEFASRLSYDVAFFSVTGFSDTGEMSVRSEDFACLLGAVLPRAEKRVCLLIDEKRGKRAFFSAGDASLATHVIGHAPFPPSLTARYPGTVFLSAEK